MKEDDLGGLGLPVGPVGSLVIIYWGGLSREVGGARDVGYGRGSSVVCNYDVISYDLILTPLHPSLSSPHSPFISTTYIR